MSDQRDNGISGRGDSKSMEPSPDCIYRLDPHTNGDAEYATCALLKRITGLPDAHCAVRRDACEACCDAHQGIRWNPVLASLIYQASDHHLTKNDDLPEADFTRFDSLKTRAEKQLLAQDERFFRGFFASCDVVVACPDSGELTKAAIESVLAQRDAVVIAHLVDFGNAGGLLEQFSSHWNVRIHRATAGRPLLSVVHDLIQHLETPFIALQSGTSTSLPYRISKSTAALIRLGAEIFAAPALYGSNQLDAEQPQPKHGYRRYVPTSTLVFRRATFVDMGGTADRPDADIEFVYRAACERREITIDSTPTVSLTATPRADLLASPPSYAGGPGSKLNCHARGFVSQRVECDVVLPFLGQLEYAREAIESVLSQEDASVVIHLIDDATPDNTTDFFRHWKGHPQIRLYRNRRNIGQFASFNNVAKYFETDLVAVQDADDISLPHRIVTSGNLLRLSAADFFGGAVSLFGEEFVTRPVFVETDQLEVKQRQDFRLSFYPSLDRIVYFLENPTALFRVNMFREMGGYADFGDRLANRASVDTEFQIRCLLNGVRFAISRRVVTKYRVHADSATQNPATGWGTAARAKASQQVEFRSHMYRQKQFDPRVFGALHRHSSVTERL